MDIRGKLLVVAAAALLIGCSEDEVDPKYVAGKNRFTLELQGDTREYYVHVPAGYTEDAATPVVFMLHGTSGDGDKFYNVSGWTEVGESEGILTVFPSSWHHCVEEDGDMNHTTKWNVYPGSFTYCAGEVPRDDIGFLKAMIEALDEKFHIDRKRMYIVGFSNGGQMAGRAAAEMGDQFAAACANGGYLPADTVISITRHLPVLFQVGNKDDRFLPETITEWPMDSFAQIIAGNTYFHRVIQSHLLSYGIEDTYVIQGTPETQLIASYPATVSDPHHVFHFSMVKNMYHVYPNGSNHWMHGAEVQWNWMKQFSLP